VDDLPARRHPFADERQTAVYGNLIEQHAIPEFRARRAIDHDQIAAVVPLQTDPSGTGSNPIKIGPAAIQYNDRGRAETNHDQENEKGLVQQRARLPFDSQEMIVIFGHPRILSE
jgi:hypothetical protein